MGFADHVKPLSLVTSLIGELRRRHPELDPERLDNVVLGMVSPVGDQGMNIAKAAALASGLPDQVAGVQLNRFCASSLEAVNTAAQKVRSGGEQLMIAGGVESMSRVPMGSDGGPMAANPETAFDTYFVPQGIGADLIATIDGFSREDVDAYAVRSQKRAAHVWSGGYFAKSMVPVPDRNGATVLAQDEHPRPETTTATLGKLKPSFTGIGAMADFDTVALQKYHRLERIEHVHTPGNSFGIVDGSALVLVGTERASQGRDNAADPPGAPAQAAEGEQPAGTARHPRRGRGKLAGRPRRGQKIETGYLVELMTGSSLDQHDAGFLLRLAAHYVRWQPSRGPSPPHRTPGGCSGRRHDGCRDRVLLCPRRHARSPQGRSCEAAMTGMGYSEQLLAKAVARGRLSRAEADEILAHIMPTADPADLTGCDLVIEAVIEDPDLKLRVFREIEDVVVPDAVLGSDTSTLARHRAGEGRQAFGGLHRPALLLPR